MMRQRQPRRRAGSTLPALRLGERGDKAGGNQRAHRNHDESASSDTGPDPRAYGPGGPGGAGAPGTPDTGRDRDDGGAFSDPAFVSDIVFKRILAHIVDTAILLAIMAPLGFFAMVTALATFGLLILPFTLAFLGLRFLYYVGFTAGAKSATPGMRMLGIELRTVDGGRPDFLQAFLRLAVYYVLIGLLTPLILLVALFNRQRRALHDMVSETVVVNRLAALAA